MENVTVISHAGTRPAEYPLRFYSEGRKIEIIEIKKRWLSPGCRCFRVLGDDNIVYDLQYDENKDTWSLLTINRP